MKARFFVNCLSLLTTLCGAPLVSQTIQTDASNGRGLSTCSASAFDVFPLSSGYRFDYVYLHRQAFWTLASVWERVDSGTVTCIVMDSSIVDDTTTAWQVREVRELVHSVHYSEPGWLTVDSTTYIRDSSTIDLFERTTGAHAMTCGGLVWAFPLEAPANASAAVYRYADSSELQLTQSVDGCTAISARFSAAGGFLYADIELCGAEFGGGIGSDSKITSLVSGAMTSVSLPSSGPRSFSLLQNHPNPFNPATEIEYRLADDAFATLKVYDALGREVITLVNEFQQAGTKAVRWDARELASGVYFYRLTAGRFTETRKLLLQK